MKILGKVVDTYSAKKGQSGLPRPKVEKLNLIYKFGIENDKFAGSDEEKAVMIVGTYTYNKAKENDINIEYGSLGENILLDFNPHDFNEGSVFQIGETILEITQACTICNHLSIFDDDLPLLIQDCRGLYCKILKGGIIQSGYSIKLIKNWQGKIAS